jgi:hypothetical protein
MIVQELCIDNIGFLSDLLSPVFAFHPQIFGSEAKNGCSATKLAI